MELVQELYQSGLSREDVLELLRLVDWFLNLPEPLENRFWKELDAWEKENRMPYVTSWERRGMRIGEQQGRMLEAQEAVLDILQIDHGPVPDELEEAVRGIADLPRLRELHRAAAKTESLEAFRRQLEV